MRVELGAVVLVVVGAVHRSVPHGDDPGTSRSVLRPVGLLRSQDHTHTHTHACGCVVVRKLLRHLVIFHLFNSKFDSENPERIEQLGRMDVRWDQTSSSQKQ